MKPLRYFFNYFIISIFLGILPNKALANAYTDSLEVRLILVDDQKKVEILNLLSEHYLRNNPKEALIKANQALELSREITFAEGTTRSLRNMGKAHKNLLSDYDKALEYCFEALNLEEKLDLTKNRIHTLMAIADIYREVGNNYKSMEYLEQAELLVEKHDYPYDMGLIQLGIGRNYILLNDPEEALERYKRALLISKMSDLPSIEAQAHKSMGEYYSLLDNSALSMEHFGTALEQFTKLNDEFEIAETMALIGKVNQNKHQITKAHQYYSKALAISKKIEDKVGVTARLLDIASCYLEDSAYQKAFQYLQPALNNAEELNEKHLLKSCYDLYYYAYLGQDNYKKAAEYRNMYAAISELIFSEESDRKVAEIQSKYELDKKNLEIETLQQQSSIQTLELEKRRNLIYGFIILLVVMLAFGGFIMHSNHERKKVNLKLEQLNLKLADQNKELSELNTTKDKFFSIIGHDLKGPLNSLSAFSNLLMNHTSQLSKEEIQLLAKDLDKSLKNLRGLLENLLTWARSQTGKLEITPQKFQVKEVIEENLELLQNTAQNKNITIQHQINGISEVYADKNSVSTVIRNLSSNALKFTNSGGRIIISAEEWKDAIEITVHDNGVGIPPEVQKKLFKLGEKHSTLGTNKEKGTGLGLMLCKEFVEKNGGQIRVESKVGKGTSFRFTIPKAN